MINEVKTDFYTYEILDPRKPGIYVYEDLTFDYEPKYIGKGRGNRITKHISMSIKNKHTCPKSDMIREIIAETGNNPILLKIYKNLTEEVAYQLEKEIIDKIGRFPNGPLTNTKDGGTGPKSHSFTSKVKKYVRSKKRVTKSKEERIYTVPENFRIERKLNSKKLKIETNFGKQDLGNNGNAGTCVLIVTDKDFVHLCSPGEFTSKCQSLGVCRTMLRLSYNHFNETGNIQRITRQKKDCNGNNWYAIRLKKELSDQIKDINMDNQQLSLLLKNIVEGKFNDHLEREYTESSVEAVNNQ